MFYSPSSRVYRILSHPRPPRRHGPSSALAAGRYSLRPSPGVYNSECLLYYKIPGDRVNATSRPVTPSAARPPLTVRSPFSFSRPSAPVSAANGRTARIRPTLLTPFPPSLEGFCGFFRKTFFNRYPSDRAAPVDSILLAERASTPPSVRPNTNATFESPTRRSPCMRYKLICT